MNREITPLQQELTSINDDAINLAGLAEILQAQAEMLGSTFDDSKGHVRDAFALSCSYKILAKLAKDIRERLSDLP